LLEKGQIRDRTARKKSKRDVDADGGDEGEDEEVEIDKFADKLADDLLRGGDALGPDIDDDDVDIDAEYSDDVDDMSEGGSSMDEEDEGVDDVDDGGSMEEEEDEMDGLDFDVAEGEEVNMGTDMMSMKEQKDMKLLLKRAVAAGKEEEDGDEFEDLMGDDDSDSDEGDGFVVKGNKKKSVKNLHVTNSKKKKKSGSDLSSFADAADYEAEMEAIVSRQKTLESKEPSSLGQAAARGGGGRYQGGKRKRK